MNIIYQLIFKQKNTNHSKGKNIAEESGDAGKSGPGSMGETEGSQLQMVTNGSNSKTSMNSGVWTERNKRIFMGVSRSMAVVLHALRKETAWRLTFCFSQFRTWKDRVLVDRIVSEL
ncbi:hypothetical protein RIF29_14160 [Crotalaria pallida]|uniref:Uncharacterized protein n=1 Tax=Crotalaria pallida TaxID=3830 RepID=A0AAN9ICH9_CROPI